jgi:hypothetical protein
MEWLIAPAASHGQARAVSIFADDHGRYDGYSGRFGSSGRKAIENDRPRGKDP